MFGFQVRLVFLWEWLTLLPNEGPLPQTLHFAIYFVPPEVFKITQQQYTSIKKGELQEFFIVSVR
jgi:hypothetical protein